MQTLPEQFSGRGSQSCYEFNQILREGRIALYKKQGEGVYYEVIIIRVQPRRETEVEGLKVVFEEKEVYPHDELFGLYGRTTRSFSRALKIYNELIQNEINKGTSGTTV